MEDDLINRWRELYREMLRAFFLSLSAEEKEFLQRKTIEAHYNGRRTNTDNATGRDG